MGATRVKTYINRLPRKDPVSLLSLYPKASKDAISLLEKILKLDPMERMTVEDALTHPFLEKYHDDEDEPLCVPPFNFDFEKEVMTKEKLKEVIAKEIEDFHEKRTKPNLSLCLRKVQRNSGAVVLKENNNEAEQETTSGNTYNYV